MSDLRVRPGLVPRLAKIHGFRDRAAFARAIGTTPKTLARAEEGAPVSGGLIAGICSAFGYGVGEIAEVIETSSNKENGPRE